MKLKHLLSLVCVVLMLVAFMAACGTTPGSAPPANAEVVELTVLNYFSYANPGSAEEDEVMWKAFEAAHPNIKINREDAFDEPFHQATEAYAAAGTIPDVIFCWPSGRSTTLHSQKLLKDLSPLVARDGLAQYYTPYTLDPTAQVGGYLAMISQGVTATNAFFVNTEVLNDCGLKPAKTYSELVAQVPVLKAKGYETILMPCLDDWVMQSCLFSLVAGRFCGEGFEQGILSGQTKFTDPDFVAALNFIKQMYDDGVLNQSTLAVDYGEGPGLFATNKAAYYIDGDWRGSNFVTDNTTGEALIAPNRQENILVTVFPDIDLPGVKFNRSNSVVMGTGWGMNANLKDGSAKLEAAWTLVKWLCGNEVETFMLRTGRIVSASRTDIDLGSMTVEPLLKKLYNLNNEYDTATVVLDGVFPGPVYTPLNEGLQAMGMGSETPEGVARLTQAAFDAWDAAGRSADE